MVKPCPISRIYKSVPLKDSSFRVLVIHPSVDIEAEVVCTLQRVDIDEGNGSSIPYEALSYTWQPVAEEQTIILHSTPYRVGRNCFEALRRIRWTAGIRRVFVDAVCINQEDKIEIDNQVAFMGQVYTHADRVLAWLGEIESSTSDYIRITFRDMKKLYMFRRLFGNYESGKIARTVRKGLFTWESSLPILIGGLHVYHWLDFVDTPYFDRLWTLQETALSRKCILIAGEHKIPMEVAEWAISFVTPYQNTLSNSQNGKPHFMRRWSGFLAHNSLKEAVSARGDPKLASLDEIWHTLHQVIYDIQSRLATHAYDKLYGFYGVLQVLCDVKLPQPDRTLPPPLLWTLGTQAVLRGFRSLDLLCDVANDDRCAYHRTGVECSKSCREGSPGEEVMQNSRWTYIWDGKYDPKYTRWHRPLEFEEQRPPRNTPWDTEPKFFSMPEGRMPISTVLTKESMLIVRGLQIDAIRTRTDPPDFIVRLYGKDVTTFGEAVEDKGPFFAQMTHVLHDWADMLQGFSERWMDLFYEIVTWGKNIIDLFGSAHRDVDPREEFQVWYNKLTRPLSPEVGVVASLSKGIEERLRELKNWHRGLYHLAVCHDLLHRCLFLTEGGLVGSTWYTVREGDLVVLLCWSLMPAILRPLRKSKFAARLSPGDPEQYLLIGFAYVHGLMDCSKWDMPEDELEEFIII